MDLVLLSRKKLPFWEILLIIYLFVAYLLPAYSLGSTILLALLLVYCAYMMIIDADLLPIVAISLVLIVLLALFYTLLTDTRTIAQDVANRTTKQFTAKMYQYTSLYFPAFLFFRVHKTATRKQKLLLTGAGIALMVYVIVITWIYLIENPGAIKQWGGDVDLSSMNLAGYYFVYAVPMIISVMSIIMIQFKGIPRWLSIVAVILGIIFLVNAQYTLAILIAVIGVLFQIFRNIRSTLNKILFALCVIALSLFLPQILEYAIRIIPSKQVVLRLSEILDFLVGKGADGYNLNGRLTLYGDTIKAFLQSPFIGNRQLDFDGHATFLTVLSDTGILGGLPFYGLFFSLSRHTKKQLGEHKAQFGVVTTMFGLMGLTNPIHASLPLGLTTWFLAPLAIELIFKEDAANGKALEN
ncbi:MAG: hypothetical protein IJO72_06085 [Oscillospiraceae bacterium]|nr:hypothetical protein [Oscillospiraceae bacterium]MBQ9930329.1 hypothetical protein [Oscillospiraceae bacterium]